MKRINLAVSLPVIAVVASSFYAQVATPAEVKIAPAVFDAYVGQYQPASDPDMIFSIFREDGHFYVQPTDQAKVEIFAQSESRFFVKAFPAALDFIRGADGKVVSLTWH